MMGLDDDFVKRSIKDSIVLWDMQSSNVSVISLDTYYEITNQFTNPVNIFNNVQLPKNNWGGMDTEIRYEEDYLRLCSKVLFKALSLIIDDNVNPVAVNKAFNNLSEYRACCEGLLDEERIQKELSVMKPPGNKKPELPISKTLVS